MSTEASPASPAPYGPRAVAPFPSSAALLASALLVFSACAREPTTPVEPAFSVPLPSPSADKLVPSLPSSASIATAARDWYTRDVWMVETAPSAIFLLARFDEPPGAGCEERLFAHARGLGANRLFIDRSEPCRGAAYMVRAPNAGGVGPSTRSRWGLRGGPVNTAEMAGWVRARWKRPQSLPAEEAARLCAVVQFQVSPMRRIWNVRGQPIQSSGNRVFDDSVRAALESAIDEHATVPAPPDDLLGDYLEYRVEVSGGGGCPPSRARSGEQ